ncbi:MAG: chemotaxis protein CheB [Chloroflexota bacterium]
MDETNRCEKEVKACTAAYSVVSMAASAGGLAAFLHVLSRLPADFPVPILIVQHVARHHSSQMHLILNRRTVLRARLAADGDVAQAGQIYIAPPDYHLLIEPGGVLRLSQSEPVNFVRPSADRLFISTAESYGERAIAVVLTGCGKDGGDGVRTIKQRGGIVIAQDEETSECFGMPGTAVAVTHVDFVLPLDEIAPLLIELVTKNRQNQEQQNE